MTMLMRRPMASRVRAPVGGGAGGRDLLTGTDFTYLGKYVVGEGDANYSNGLTHRYDGENLRFMYLKFAGNNPDPEWQYFKIQEFSLPGSYDGNCTETQSWTNPWNHTWGGGATYQGNAYHSLWYDSSTSKVWTGSGFDYPQGGVTTSEEAVWATRTLGGAGVCTGHAGFWGVENVGQRANFGKVQRVPSWFQTAYNTDPLISLSGGYTSLAGQGLGPSFGPFFMIFPDPHGVYTEIDPFNEAANIPAEDVVIVADHRSGVSGVDWYSDYNGRLKDRGCRTVAYENYYDATGSHSSRPTDPPVDENWYDPAPNDPDGWGRWVWGDHYYDTGNWIDNDAGTRTKHGIVCIASLGKGKNWYQGSTLNSDFRAYEIHIFHPEDIASVKAGSLSPWKLRPRSITEISVPNFGTVQNGGNQTSRNLAAATYDPVTNKLYVMGFLSDGGSPKTYMFVYSVGGS